jgi:hypothetical protein
MTTLNSTASGALAPLWRRAFEWWLVQVKHVLPPTIFANVSACSRGSTG